MQINIRQPDDFHVHFRRGSLAKSYIAQSSAHFARAIVMPNTQPSIQNATDLVRYRQEILDAQEAVLAEQAQMRGECRYAQFEPLMTFKLYAKQTAQDIEALKAAGAIAGKLYPQGATTHAEDGVGDVRDVFSVLESMEAHGIVLCIHGEDPQVFVLDREAAFLKTVDFIRAKFPRLKIVLEHVSTEESVRYVAQANSDLLGATVTVHHLLYTLDDLMGNFLNPHLFCKPVLKSPKDLQAIQSVVLEGNARFFLGTDSAPHQRGQKECECGCAGVFSAPVAMALLAEFFYARRAYWSTQDEWIQVLERFCSQHGADHYGLPHNTRKICIAHTQWQVPAIIAGVVPLCANNTLNWQVKLSNNDKSDNDKSLN